MAMPIRETPVLEGQVASDFIKEAERTAQQEPNIEEIDTAMETYNRVMKAQPEFSLI